MPLGVVRAMAKMLVDVNLKQRSPGTLFFPPRDLCKISSSEHRRPPFAQNFLLPLVSFFSFFPFLLHIPYLHCFQDGLRKALRSPCMCPRLSSVPDLILTSLNRRTVVPSPSWSLPSTTAWTSSWSRLRRTLPPTTALSTARFTPSARSLLSRVPMASTCPRSWLLPSTVSC